MKCRIELQSKPKRGARERRSPKKKLQKPEPENNVATWPMDQPIKQSFVFNDSLSSVWKNTNTTARMQSCQTPQKKNMKQT
jgi:hypothetical protein